MYFKFNSYLTTYLMRQVVLWIEKMLQGRMISSQQVPLLATIQERRVREESYFFIFQHLQRLNHFHFLSLCFFFSLSLHVFMGQNENNTVKNEKENHSRLPVV